VSELSLNVQAKLLQLLQSKEYYPLGAAKPLRADVRVIAATNADLQQAVAEKRFREDLYYRLHVLPLRVPSLDERRGDIPMLAAFFCRQTSERHNLPALMLSSGALRALESASWPGNIRQIQHAVEAAVIRASGENAAQVEAIHIFPDAGSGASPAADAPPATLQDATRAFQARLLRQTLEDTRWNVLETSRRLDVARSHLYVLIRAFGLERDRK
jgi:Nif-specific regulatory protein